MNEEARSQQTPRQKTAHAAMYWAPLGATMCIISGRLIKYRTEDEALSLIAYSLSWNNRVERAAAAGTGGASLLK